MNLTPQYVDPQKAAIAAVPHRAFADPGPRVKNKLDLYQSHPPDSVCQFQPSHYEYLRCSDRRVSGPEVEP